VLPVLLTPSASTRGNNHMRLKKYGLYPIEQTKSREV
jgi:hypothetical protein